MRMVYACALGFALMNVTTPSHASPDTTPPTKEQAKSEASGFTQMWVTTERLKKHTCPSKKCGVVGQLFFRESAHVIEKSKGWARITRFYDASCVGGRSEYVDSGDSSCTTKNGVSDQKFAEWVELKSLSDTRPADPAKSAAADETIVADSDDFSRHRRVFAKAAAKLIADGTCTRQDFKEMGGWMKSVTQYRDRPVYFTYCGGMTSANKIYLDASTGKTFR